jgi:hypothetical protein
MRWLSDDHMITRFHPRGGRSMPHPHPYQLHSDTLPHSAR